MFEAVWASVKIALIETQAWLVSYILTESIVATIPGDKSDTDEGVCPYERQPWLIFRAASPMLKEGSSSSFKYVIRSKQAHKSDSEEVRRCRCCKIWISERNDDVV